MRRPKEHEVDVARFDAMSRLEKLELCDSFSQLFHYTLPQIPCSELCQNLRGRKAEEFAEGYYRDQGFEVYRSRIRNGYRCIGVEFYWQERHDSLTPKDRHLIELLRSVMSAEEFEELAWTVKEKNGTPDLLLIKEGRISFVEVKCGAEEVKPATIIFYIYYSERWPISILRIKPSAFGAEADDFVITLNNPTPEQIAWFNKL